MFLLFCERFGMRIFCLVVCACLMMVGGVGVAQASQNTQRLVLNPRAPNPAVNIIRGYFYMVFTIYKDAVIDARALEEAVQDYLNDPNDDTLELAKIIWGASRESYAQTEAFRFYNGPIDEVDENGVAIGPEPRINGCEARGGYHAIYDFLWQHSPDDFVDASQNAERRAELLNAAKFLPEELQKLADIWGPGELRKNMMGDVDQSFSNMLKGLATLSAREIADKRLVWLYERGRDCGYGARKSDLAFNLKAIENIYFGYYDGVEAPSIYQYLYAVDRDLAETIKAQFDVGHDILEALPDNVAEAQSFFRSLGDLMVQASYRLSVPTKIAQ